MCIILVMSAKGAGPFQFTFFHFTNSLLFQSPINNSAAGTVPLTTKTPTNTLHASTVYDHEIGPFSSGGKAASRSK
jgi:hypothetical protein